MDATDFKSFLHGYLVCALWSSVEDEGNPLGDNYSIDDLAPEAAAQAEEECKDFLLHNTADILDAIDTKLGYTWSSAGHDFWLTRCGHGAGFWDRGLGDIGQRLSDAAHIHGNRDIYVGDDGKLYFA